MNSKSFFTCAVVWLVGVSAAHADDAVSGPECSANVCVLNVIATDVVPAPCAGDSVLVAYSTSSGATLIQCSQPSDGQETQSFIYDRLNPRVKSFEFLGGRFMRPDSWAEAKTKGIPDKFASVPLCPAKNREAPAAGVLVILEKQPSSSGDNPYCYRVNYVVAGKNSLTVRSDEGQELSPLSDKAARRWVPLKEKLSPRIATSPNPSAAGIGSSMESTLWAA